MADLDDAAVDVWPDNMAAVNVLIATATQWRTGMSGVVGLDYNVLPSVFTMMQVPSEDWPDTFECVRVLEEEAMRVINRA